MLKGLLLFVLFVTLLISGSFVIAVAIGLVNRINEYMQNGKGKPQIVEYIGELKRA